MADKQAIEEISQVMPEDLPEMSADVGRAPSVAMKQHEGGQGLPDQPTTRRELDQYNPVIQELNYVAGQMNMSPDDPEVLAEVSKRRSESLAKRQFTEQRRLQAPDTMAGEGISISEVPSIQSVSVGNIQGKQAQQSGGNNSPGIAKKVGGIDPTEQIKVGYQNQMVGNIDEAVEGEVDNQLTTGLLSADQQEQKLAQDDYKKALQDAKDYRDKMAGEINEISKKFIQGKINPDRWYDNRSTGQKIALGIGAFLNGFGGGTEVLTMMQNAINNDIRAQEESYKRGSGSLKNMYGLIKDIYGQDKDSAKILYALQLQNIKNKVAVMSSKIKDGDKLAKLGKLNGVLQVELGKELHKIGMDRAKLIADTKKDMKISGEDRARGIKIATAKQGFQKLSRAFKKGVNTFSAVGDNEFTAGLGMFVNGLGFLLSGANVPVEEKEAFRKFVAGWKDGRGIQIGKLRDMKRLFDKYDKIMTATTMPELKEAIGANKYSNPNFKRD